MKQHNASDERKWNSKRERERRRARFQIRERVSALSHGIEEQPIPSYELSIENMSDEEHELLYNIMVYIRKGDRSKMSFTFIDRHFDILSCRIPIKILETARHLQHTLQLCTAWFGKEYSISLENYIGSLEYFTFMEYAVWMGKADVVGSLLVGGVNPCVRSVYSTTDRTKEQKWDKEMWRTGSKVLVRFFDAFPIPLSSYIVKRVVEMRLEAYKGNHFCDSEVCPLSGRLVPPGVLLQFEPDGDVFSESCFWEHLLSHIDSMGSNEDVVKNPCCNAPREYQDFTLVESKDLSPMQKRLESLQRLNSIPVNAKELKIRSKKKKKKVSVAKSWFDAILPSLGCRQDVRRDKFFTYVDRNAIQYIKACINAGVDLEWSNEYGQTALYICIWKGYMEMAKILVDCGASLSAVANGGSSVLSLLDETQEELGIFGLYLEQTQCQCDNNPVMKANFTCADDQCSDPHPQSATILIPEESSHPGAGSFLVENAFSLSQVELLLNLCESLPIDLDQKKKDTPCSDRSYYCDAEGYIRQVLEKTVSDALSVSFDDVVVFPYMRFLMYQKKGTILAPHVDLCRVDDISGRRSTHTFIAYLTDNDESGETTLLGDVSGEGRSKIMARVSPRRGRLLVFPHVCPHEGNEVDQVPKIILRGEVMLPELSKVAEQ